MRALIFQLDRAIQSVAAKRGIDADETFGLSHVCRNLVRAHAQL